jgi:hypothetical protein
MEGERKYGLYEVQARRAMPAPRLYRYGERLPFLLPTKLRQTGPFYGSGMLKSKTIAYLELNGGACTHSMASRKGDGLGLFWTSLLWSSKITQTVSLN